MYLVYFVVQISLRTLRPCVSALKHLQHLHGRNLCALCVLLDHRSLGEGGCGYQSTRLPFATSTFSLHPPYLPIDYPPIPEPLPEVLAPTGDAVKKAELEEVADAEVGKGAEVGRDLRHVEQVEQAE